MNKLLIALLVIFITTTLPAQVSVDIGYGREVAWQYGPDGSVPQVFQFSTQAMISQHFGLVVGYRRLWGNKTGWSNASNQRTSQTNYFAIVERGVNSSNEFFIGPVCSYKKLNLTLGIGYAGSTVDSENFVVQRETSTNALLDEQILSVRYKQNYFMRASIGIRYSLLKKNGFALVPYVEYLYDVRSTSELYTVQQADDFRAPFDSVDALTDFRTTTKSQYLKPSFFNIGIGLRYTWEK